MSALPDTLAFVFWMLHRTHEPLSRRTNANLKKRSPEFQRFWIGEK